MAAETLTRARLRGINVHGETLASSIGCSLNNVKESGTLQYITSPPIRRDPETPRFLMKSLAV